MFVSFDVSLVLNTVTVHVYYVVFIVSLVMESWPVIKILQNNLKLLEGFLN